MPCLRLAALVVLGTLPGFAWAQTVFWIADTPGNWSTGTNWSTSTPPAPGDDVVFYNIHVGNSLVTAGFNATNTVRSITVQGYTGTITFGGAALTLTGNLFVASGNFNAAQAPALSAANFVLSGGSFTAPMQLYVNGNWLRSGGVFNHNLGTVFITVSAQQTLDAGGNAAHFNHLLVSFSDGALNLINTDLFVDGNLDLESTKNGADNFRVNDRSMTVNGKCTIAGGRHNFGNAGTVVVRGGLTIGGNTSQGQAVTGDLKTAYGPVYVTDVLILGSDTPGLGYGNLDAPDPINVSGNWVAQKGTASNARFFGSANFFSGTAQTLDCRGLGTFFDLNHIGAGTLAIVSDVKISEFTNVAGTVKVHSPATMKLFRAVLTQANDLSTVDANDGTITINHSLIMSGGLLRSGPAGSIQILDDAGITPALTASTGAGAFQPVIQGNYLLPNIIQPITVQADTELRIEANIAGLAGALPGITKAGAGTLRLSGTNSYQNTTSVNAGTLIVDGDNSFSNTLVKSGCTLRGAGKIGPLTVNAGGNVRPGSSAPGTLTVVGDASLSAGSNFIADIFGLASNHGQLKVNGAVALNNANLVGTATSFPAPFGTQFALIDNDQADAITGTFSNLPQNAQITLSGRVFDVSYTGGTGNDFVLTLQNQKPLIDVAPSAQPPGGSFTQTILFSALAHDPEGSPVAYDWDFGDNSPNGQGASVNHTYAAAGTYVVTLLVSDGTATVTATLTLVLTDSEPVFDVQPSFQPNPASFALPVNFSATAHDPDGLPLSYAWDFGDGAPFATGSSVQHTYGVPGAFVAVLTVSDGTKVVAKPLNVSVTDSAPVIDVQPAATPNPASFTQAVAFSVSAGDPDGLPLTYTWDFGDGTTAAPGASVQHTFAPGAYVVSLTVFDGTKTTVQSLNVSVTDSVPVIDSFDFPDTGIAGQPVVLSAVAHDPDGLPLTYSWNFGDLTPSETGASVSHQYAFAGKYYFTLTVSDGTKSASIGYEVSIAPFAPAFDSPPEANPNPALISQLISFSVSPRSAYPNSTLTWDFGDGTSSSGPVVTHSYAAAGTYTVKVKLLDPDGIFSETSLIVTVRGARIGLDADSDADGFSDATELATGTDSADPNSNVLGKPLEAANVSTLPLTKTQIKLNFAKANGDSIALNGILELPLNFTPLGKVVLLDVGGVSRKFTLSSSGTAKQGSDNFKLNAKKLPSAKFTASLAKGAFAPTLASSSGLNNDNVSAGQRTVLVSIAFSGSVQQVSQPLRYKAKKNKQGVATK